MDSMRPASSMPAIAPPESAYDGKSRFGSWTIPGLAGWRTMVLEGDRFTDGIRATIDGHLVLTCPWPIGEHTATWSLPWIVDGHQIVVYAESWDLGQTVRCDVFVDGYSLSTGEPIQVISYRAAVVPRIKTKPWWMTKRAWETHRASDSASRVESWVTSLSIGEILPVGAHAHGILLAGIAGGLLVVVNVGIVRAGRLALQFARSRSSSPSAIQAATAVVVLGCIASGVAAFLLAILLVDK